MKTREKVGKVSIKVQDRDQAVFICYWNPAARKIVTKSVGSTNMNVARKQAAALNAQINRGESTVVEAHSRISVREAMELAVKASHSRDEHHRSNLQDRIRYFVDDWLSKCRPDVHRWDQVNCDVLENYIEYLRDQRGVCAKTGLSYCSVIGITSTYWKGKNPRLYMSIPITHEWFSNFPSPSKNFLTTIEAWNLLSFARSRKSRSDTGIIAVALGCFAGLNLKEIANLKVGWIDLSGPLVDIRQSKNASRIRKIPVAGFLRPLLIRAVTGRGPEEFLIRSQGGQIPSEATLSRNLHRHLLAAATKSLKCESYDRIAPKDVRKTFANIAVAAGIDELVLQAYFGHAQYTTFRKNYAESNLISRFQSEVVVPLESHLRRVVTENARDVKDVERMVDTPRIKLIPEERDPLDILSVNL